jgi:hypothetical protein
LIVNTEFRWPPRSIDRATQLLCGAAAAALPWETWISDAASQS